MIKKLCVLGGSKKYLSFFIILFLITSCSSIQLPYEIRQILNRLQPELKSHQVFVGDPVFIRIFKEENILELWMKGVDASRYELIKTYPICKWSGRLGPKLREGDFQSPEGFYATTADQLNPNSRYHLSFNIGFPNAFDQYHDRTGTFLMIHGDCESEGCYAMTDPLIEEIYVLVERSLMAGEYDVPVHIFPFRMTTERLMMETASPHFDFWMNLKEGHDYFNKYGVPPKWTLKNGQYDFY